jgi:hypothetical protein
METIGEALANKSVVVHCQCKEALSLHIQKVKERGQEAENKTL